MGIRTGEDDRKNTGFDAETRRDSLVFSFQSESHETWTTADQGESWTKRKQLTAGSEFNHTYARRPVDAHPDFYALWADGHGRQESDSRLYICDRAGENVRRLPTTMTEDFATPEQLK